MGFYNKCNYLYLPNKRIVDDLIERNGDPNEESFTPYRGMNELVEEQMRGPRYSILGIDVIKENISELMVTKLKGKEEYSVDESSWFESDVYSYLLEEIDEEYVRNFIRSQLIGIKVNTTGAKQVVKASENVQYLMRDQETGDVYNPSDDYVKSDEFEDGLDAMSEVRSKIPYLLKKLQDGSIKYGVSLLSLFIARDAVIQKLHRRDGEIKPREILSYPIYNVSSNGELLDTFDPATANNVAKFRAPKDLVFGVNPNDPYYKAGVELTVRARKLGYNLYEEDARDYSPAYINRLMCSYILSNQEVLTDMASYDPSILKLFQDGSLFKVPSIGESEVRSVNKVLKLREMATQKLCMVPELHARCDADGSLYRKFTDPINLINQFFNKYRSINKRSSMKEECTADCFLKDDVLCDSSEQPLIFKGDAFVIGFNDTPMFNHVYFILTNRGYAIKVDDSIDSIVMTDVVSMVSYYDTKNCELFRKGSIKL